MTKIIIFLLTILSFGKLSAQCGVNFLYDAAGNRTQRIECVSLLQTNPSDIAKTNDKVSNDRESIEKEAPWGDLSLFPNPSSGVFQINTDDFDAQSSVWLLDAKCQTLQQRALNDGFFDISDKPAGIYFLKIQNAGNVKTARFIKN